MTEGGMNVSEMMTKNTRRNWRKLLAVGVLTLVVLSLLITAAIFLTGKGNSGNPPPTTSSITIEQWLEGWLTPKGFNGTWLTDDEILLQDENGNLIIYNITSDSSKLVLAITHPVLGSPLTFNFELSPNRKYLLVASNHQKFYRYTYFAQYRIVNLRTLNETLLSVGNSTTLQLATWASKGNDLVFVHFNDIYYRPEAEKSLDYRITTNGVFRTIYNGVPDWVYEEEVFNSNKVLWFSPSGKKMVFAHFNDMQTQMMNITFYGLPGSLSFQYTSTIPIHYPKSGTTNPKAKLFYVDLERVVADNGYVSIYEIKYPPQLANTERVLAAVSFPTENLVSVTWMNRIQNKAVFQLYDVRSSINYTVLSFAENSGWLDQFESPLFSRTGREFLLILPQKQLDNDSWPHVVMVTNVTSRPPKLRTLTFGSFAVTKIVGWDEDNSLVYYVATLADDPGQQHVYRLSTLEKVFKPECLSCELKNEIEGTFCLHNDAELSPDKSRYMLTCGGPGVPEVSIYNSANATKILTWEDNKPIAATLAEKSKPTVKRFSVPVQGGFNAQVRLFLPPGADLTGTTKYPLVIFVYGGPGTQQIAERFNIDWGTYLATNKSIIYGEIDGRGSGLKGSNMKFAGYRNLGTVEIYDQINVTRHLQENFPFIDKTKTAIWGWSYGGYAAGMSLAMDQEGIFKCGMSVAPVTDWTLYDSVYTERFMGLPITTDNFHGYEQAQLLNKAANIKSNSYYLIHGTLDDNVHYQQSLLLAKVLEQKDILFRQQTYTDEDHGIGSARLHLYHSMENFLDDCFRS
ncbi:venom dipeptidyl peptidase 4 isoform X2 [Chelonus insularis]|uniref:venom dipeptidyl peptidase 4 isoform X2 n=1 Tax=Chelonus insularis TaxID=460826 RepID=UPI001589A07F|nr:venom dipeptidyl peptidase 4 isoform X2 [Chelonus insularis]